MDAIIRPACDRKHCLESAADDGYVEVEALVGRELVTARVRLCSVHLELATGRRSLAA